MIVKDTKISQVGAFRCCLESLLKILDKEKESFCWVGQIVEADCPCKTKFQLGKDGIWRAVLERDNVHS